MLVESYFKVLGFSAYVDEIQNFMWRAGDRGERHRKTDREQSRENESLAFSLFFFHYRGSCINSQLSPFVAHYLLFKPSACNELNSF